MTWPTSNPIARELDDFYKETQSLMQQWWFQADLDTKMTTGQQDYFQNQYTGNYRNQRQLQFNKILRLINMIGGYQRKNRLATSVIPADNDPDMGETSDQFTTVINWIMRQDQTYEKISDCFDGANICGLNLLSVWMDFREDPESGSIKTTRLPFSSFIMDPYWEQADLSDCNRIWTRKYLDKRQLLSIMPKVEKDIPLFGKGYANKDGKFQFLPQNWYQIPTEMYAYDEYWTRDYRRVRKILDTSTGELAEWRGNREQFQLLRQYNPNVELITATMPTVKLNVLVNNNVVYEETSPYGLNRFPFVPFVCYHYPEVQDYAYRYQGIVRNIRDSQIELNRRRNRLLDLLDAQVQSGLMVKEDTLVNPEDAFKQGPGSVLFFKKTANLASDVAPIPAPPVAQGWMELIQTLDNEIMSIVGTPEELFGENMNSKDQSGIMMQLKMGAGLTSLQNIFDRLNQSQRILGDIQIELIQNNFSYGKVMKILGKEPSQEFMDVYNTKYHAVIEEAELTSTQRQLQFMQANYLKQLGVPISNAYIIKKSTLQGKKEIIEDIEQQQQQLSQMQQAQFQQEMQQSQIMSQSLAAKAESDLAGAHEKRTRAIADIGLAQERASQAIHDRATATLENTKAMKELQEVDENRLMKLSQFIHDIEMSHRQMELEEKELQRDAANAEFNQ